jgi:pimeloyl-ACP methyl ester carboxylesterase
MPSVMRSREYLGKWSTEAAERRFRAMEDDLWAEAFPAPPETVDVPTCVGQTRVYGWSGSEVPIVFLHGAGGTALQWYEYVNRRAGHSAFAIDTIGDVGRSVQEKPFRDADHVAQWLDETLGGLEVSRAHLVGSSYGGWLALNQAVRKPSRVASLSLLDPAGVVRPDMGRFLLWGACLMIGSIAPEPVRTRVATWTRNPLLNDKRAIRAVLYGQRKHPFRLPPAGPATDDELRAIATPTLALLGEKSELYRSSTAADRLRSCVRGSEVEIVRGAGHALPLSHTDLVLARIEAFLHPA